MKTLPPDVLAHARRVAAQAPQIVKGSDLWHELRTALLPTAQPRPNLDRPAA